MKKLRSLNNKWFWLAAILLTTIVVYFPSLKFDILNYDDNRLITNNELIKNISFSNLKYYFFNYYDNIYQPFILMSWSFDYYIDGLNPFVFHTHNLILHLINISLVFLFVQLLFEDKRISIITAFLFAIQAMHIESVAWISERKDLIYSMYFLLSLVMYVKYVKTSQIRYFIFSLVVFLFSLLSKGLAVALAPTIIAIDFFLRRNIFSKKVIIEKIPFLVLAIIFSIVGWIGFVNLNKLTEFSFFTKILATGYVFFNYLTKLLYPYGLSALHPYPVKIDNYYSFEFYILPILSLFIIIGLFFLAKKNRQLAFGIIFFVINILLALRLSQVTTVGFLMADRYTYISSIGIFVSISILFIYLLKRYAKLKIPIYSLLFVYFVLQIEISSQQINVWKNSISLWDSVIEKYPDKLWSYTKLGMSKINNGDFKGAIQDYTRAINQNQEYDKAYLLRADAYLQSNRWNSAIKDYTRVIELVPDYDKAYVKRGIAYGVLEYYGKALQDFNSAIRINPDYAMAYVQRANLKSQYGYYNSALHDYNSALSIEPELITAKKMKEKVMVLHENNSNFASFFNMAN